MLNDPGIAAGRAVASDMARRLHAGLLQLASRYLDPSQKGVDYPRLRQSADLAELERLAGALVAFDPGTLRTSAERLAFWLNVYNALYIHGVIRLGVQGNVDEIAGFEHRISYRIGGHPYSPRDIEHGILRGNRTATKQPWPQFEWRDPRLMFIMSDPDPRVHFAMVCGTRSCPAVRVYEADHVDSQLDLATATYLEETVEVIEERGMLVLPVIFYSWRQDFAAAGGVLEFVARYLKGPAADWLFQHRDSLEIVFRNWDMRLNQAVLG